MRPVEPAAGGRVDLAREGEGRIVGDADAAMTADTEHGLLEALRPERAVAVLDEGLQAPAGAVGEAGLGVAVEDRQAVGEVVVLLDLLQRAFLEVGIGLPDRLLHVAQLFHARRKPHVARGFAEIDVAHGVDELGAERIEAGRERRFVGRPGAAAPGRPRTWCVRPAAPSRRRRGRRCRACHPCRDRRRSAPRRRGDGDVGAADQRLDDGEVDGVGGPVGLAGSILAIGCRQTDQHVVGGAARRREAARQRRVGEGAPAGAAAVGGEVVAVVVEAEIGVGHVAAPAAVAVGVPARRRCAQ